jgi:hypothetical protein
MEYFITPYLASSANIKTEHCHFKILYDFNLWNGKNVFETYLYDQLHEITIQNIKKPIQISY